MDDARYDVKVVMLGDSGTGKSAILKRFFNDSFDGDSASTIGIDFRHKMYKLDDKSTVRLQLWDTGGQERFRQLVPAYIREALVAIIVFDITDSNALEKIARWIVYVDKERGSETRVILVGNKADLKTQRKISCSLIFKMMDENNIMYVETSAKTGQNIQELFYSVAHLPYPHKKSTSVPLTMPEPTDCELPGLFYLN